MGKLSADTSQKMEALQAALWRAATPDQKMRVLSELHKTSRVLALTGLRQRYPQADEAELKRRLADLLLGEDLALKVYGEVHGAD